MTAMSRAWDRHSTHRRCTADRDLHRHHRPEQYSDGRASRLPELRSQIAAAIPDVLKREVVESSGRPDDSAWGQTRGRRPRILRFQDRLNFKSSDSLRRPRRHDRHSPRNRGFQFQQSVLAQLKIFQQVLIVRHQLSVCQLAASQRFIKLQQRAQQGASSNLCVLQRNLPGYCCGQVVLSGSPDHALIVVLHGSHDPALPCCAQVSGPRTSLDRRSPCTPVP